MISDSFHPAVAGWFAATFPAATPAQELAWAAIQSGRNVLVAAPTGSGKTLAAFLAAIDELVRRGQDDALPDETAVVYVSPLKALSNDIRLNLEGPLAGIRDELRRRGLRDVELRAAVRTGDTPQAERAQMARRPPHIVVTTPESLYILLGSESGRRMLATTGTVIVDEIHAVAASKRGSHLALTLERLDALCGRPLRRIGLSATQKPIEEIARFLVGTRGVGRDGGADCEIIDVGYSRHRELALEVPQAPLEAVMSGETWQQVYRRLAELVQAHRTTLVFVNTRRMAERAARHLSELLGKEAVAAHHGSLAREHRFEAERRLKRGELKVLVATASLELGIDIGDVDLVCQLGSPRGIAPFLQRVGRSGHAVDGTPRGRLFPQSRDDLVECAALLDAVRRGELDSLLMPAKPLDVLAQQLTAEIAAREWHEDALFKLARGAWPYRDLARAQFDAVLAMLAEGYTTRRGPRAALIHRDAVHGMLRARRGTRLTAITSGGAIPDNADYDVVLEPQAQRIGSVNEDFAVESLAGDVFQLGNASYRILRVERGRVRVEDAKGAPPSIPFWLGEAPGRSNELSIAVSRLRGEVAARLGEADAARAWLVEDVGLSTEAAAQLVAYLASAQAALGLLPTRQDLVMERFFDESGGTQLVIHAPYGSRINRAWGLALRKRFCRKFNFELQAAATEDAIVLSLSTSHSFPLAEVARYLHSATVADVLVQAVLDAPMFGARWRWNAVTALGLPRFVGGNKVAPQLQRMRSEDLLATVFPDQVACAENLVGEREIPDHPLVAQTLHDCLHEAMDLDGLVAVLRGLESGELGIHARDLSGPSPFAAEVLGARPYAYLDDAPLEERRTQAVMSRRWSEPGEAAQLARLDPAAIQSVRSEAWPEARSADELHEALCGLAYLRAAEVREGPGWQELTRELARDGRATCFRPPSMDAATPDCELWIAAERLPQFEAIHPAGARDPELVLPAALRARSWTRDEALLDVLRARLTGLGPAMSTVLADELRLPRVEVDTALAALETEGYVMRGHFTAPDAQLEWCERHLLARIHRYTVGQLRREIEPVEARVYMRFLLEWQRVAVDARAGGSEALGNVLAQLEGYEAPASAWESSILPARIAGYDIAALDEHSVAGRVVWMRLQRRAAPGAGRSAAPVRATPIVLLQRRNLALWTALRPAQDEDHALSSRAARLAEFLSARGASFFDEMQAGTGLLQTELEVALAELVALGEVNSDSFAGLRALLVPQGKRASTFGRRTRRGARLGLADAGRWVRVATQPSRDAATLLPPETVEHVARVLLRRYGVVCWRTLQREASWLPPWRDLLRVFHRLEARGEIRGGRFVSGMPGEQFALPEAVGLLRKCRTRAASDAVICVSGADPLNLLGHVVAGPRVPALASARIAFRDGVPVATRIAGEVQFLIETDAASQWRIRTALDGRPATALPEALQVPAR